VELVSWLVSYRLMDREGNFDGRLQEVKTYLHFHECRRGTCFLKTTLSHFTYLSVIELPNTSCVLESRNVQHSLVFRLTDIFMWSV
jgi:hypothetical protein